jgi:hypothetical protein
MAKFCAEAEKLNAANKLKASLENFIRFLKFQVNRKIIEIQWPRHAVRGSGILGANHTQACGAELWTGLQICQKQFERESGCSCQIHWRQSAPHGERFRPEPLKIQGQIALGEPLGSEAAMG